MNPGCLLSLSHHHHHLATWSPLLCQVQESRLFLTHTSSSSTSSQHHKRKIAAVDRRTGGHVPAGAHVLSLPAPVRRHHLMPAAPCSQTVHCACRQPSKAAAVQREHDASDPPYLLSASARPAAAAGVERLRALASMGSASAAPMDDVTEGFDSPSKDRYADEVRCGDGRVCALRCSCRPGRLTDPLPPWSGYDRPHLTALSQVTKNEVKRYMQQRKRQLPDQQGQVRVHGAMACFHTIFITLT